MTVLGKICPCCIASGGAEDGYILLFNAATGCWEPSALPSSGSVAWGGVTDKPSTFPPESHTHPLSELEQSGAADGNVVFWSATTGSGQWVAGAIPTHTHSVWSSVSHSMATGWSIDGWIKVNTEIGLVNASFRADRSSGSSSTILTISTSAYRPDDVLRLVVKGTGSEATRWVMNTSGQLYSVDTPSAWTQLYFAFSYWI